MCNYLFTHSIYIQIIAFLLLPVHTSYIPSPNTSPFSSEKGEAPLCMNPQWHIKSLQSWTDPLPLRPDKRAQLGKKDPQTGTNVRGSPPYPLAPAVGGPSQKSSYISATSVCWVERLGPARVCFLVGGSVSGRPQRSKQVSWLSWCFCVVPIISRSLSPSPTSSTRLPKL